MELLLSAEETAYTGLPANTLTPRWTMKVIEKLKKLNIKIRDEEKVEGFLENHPKLATALDDLSGVIRDLADPEDRISIELYTEGPASILLVYIYSERDEFQALQAIHNINEVLDEIEENVGIATDNNNGYILVATDFMPEED